jgi:TPP-dependent indolepyruvate ferredoxin oxidoreductase alpha subunit
MVVDKAKCTSCKTCLRLGCPAISTDVDGKSLINVSLCTGCGVCAQVCPYKAISYADEKGLHIGSMTLESFAKGGGK